MDERIRFTYIMASRSRTLYTGVTGDLTRRAFEHKKKHGGFSTRYNCNRLVWFERFSDVREAIQREKELKGWRRAKKLALVESANPTWEDLSAARYHIPSPKSCHPLRSSLGPRSHVSAIGVSGAKDLLLARPVSFACFTRSRISDRATVA
jgi:putative endonuclease